MHRSPYRAILIALILAVGSFAVAACGSSDNNTSSSSAPAAGSTSTAAKPAGKKIKVGLVTDIGGLNDRSFNALANKGLQDAKKQARRRRPRADLEVQRRLRAEPEHAGPAEVRPGHRASAS